MIYAKVSGKNMYYGLKGLLSEIKEYQNFLASNSNTPVELYDASSTTQVTRALNMEEHLYIKVAEPVSEEVHNFVEDNNLNLMNGSETTLDLEEARLIILKMYNQLTEISGFINFDFTNKAGVGPEFKVNKYAGIVFDPEESDSNLKQLKAEKVAADEITAKEKVDEFEAMAKAASEGKMTATAYHKFLSDNGYPKSPTISVGNPFVTYTNPQEFVNSI